MTAPSSADRSLFAAAAQLDQVADASADGTIDIRQTRRALRAASVAVEACLDELVGVDGLAAEVTSSSPRLIYATESLEAGLARSLVDLWESEVNGLAPDQGLSQRMKKLALQLRHLGNREIDLLWESLNEPAATD